MILFGLLYKKYHRSIIKTVIEASQNRHKASCIIAKLPTRKKCPKISDTLGTQCPPYGQQLPVTCSLNARHLVPECPLDGQGQTA